MWPEHVQKAVKVAGCDVEDHQRGLRSWANLGADTIVIPVKVNEPGIVDYYPMRERTLSALDEQIWRLVSRSVTTFKGVLPTPDGRRFDKLSAVHTVQCAPDAVREMGSLRSFQAQLRRL